MGTIVSTALFLSLLVYVYIGFFYKRSIHRISDIIPIVKNSTASVVNSKEFSSSTVATTISLATVIIAFYELVPFMGWWLLWPVVTTAFGLWVFSKIVKKIWERMSYYDHRPSLHEFMGVEFGSRRVALVGSLFTVMGYLTAFAVELTVGARFLAGLVPEIPQWITVIIITSIAFIYVSLGGFRATVVTDRVQMIFIWLLLSALLAFYGYFMASYGVDASLERIPDSVKHLSWNNTLLSFVLGILFMNAFMYVSNMGLWQRISGSNNPETVVHGMMSSVYKTGLSWGLFVVVAVGAFMVTPLVEGENLLVTFITQIEGSFYGRITTFFVVLGLYGAMLSTASTQLIAVSHTIYEDILAPYRKIDLHRRLESKKELGLSRQILLLSAIVSVGVVEVLRIGGFSVADLAFAIYGAALGMSPAILLSLYWPREKLRLYGGIVNTSIILGFLSGWGSAIVGKILGNGNLVFLAPLVSFSVATFILTVGIAIAKVMSSETD